MNSPNGASPRSLSVPQDAKSNPSNGLVERVARIVDPDAWERAAIIARYRPELLKALGVQTAKSLSKAREIHALYQQEGVLSSQRGENRSANAISGPTLHGADTEAAGSAGVSPEFIAASAKAAIRALRGLEQTAIMLETWAPECFPILPEHNGKAHFARVLMESAAEEIRNAWASAIKEVESLP